MKSLNGSELAGFIKERQAKAVRNLRQSHKIFPKLAIVQTIDSPVINSYVRLKQSYGADILVDVEHHQVAQNEAVELIQRLNDDSDIHGIIVQLPLDDPAATGAVLAAVAPQKDVDGLAPDSQFDAATPVAINWLLAGYGIDVRQHKVAIVGMGRLVGAPLVKMWQQSGVEIETFDESTGIDKLADYDLVVTATGQAGLIESHHLQIEAVVVDAGTSSEHGRIVGDVSDDVRQRDDLTITPLKGGVGPLTVSALFDNVITAARRQNDLS